MYDTGNQYFTRLKAYCRGYMVASGFNFKVKLSTTEGSYDFAAHEREAKFLQGLLSHSQRDHGKAETTGDKALAFIAGAV